MEKQSQKKGFHVLAGVKQLLMHLISMEDQDNM